MMGINDAAEIYIKSVHYRFDHTWKECLECLYAHGLTKAQHRELVHIRAEFSKTIQVVADGLNELDRSMEAREPESARFDTWASIKQAKEHRIQLTDRAIAIAMKAGAV